MDWMSATPARRFGLDGIGEIRIGMNADLFLADLDNEYTIHAQQFESMGKNTPFDGMKVHAAICQTFINGQSVWKGNEE